MIIEMIIMTIMIIDMMITLMTRIGAHGPGSPASRHGLIAHLCNIILSRSLWWRWYHTFAISYYNIAISYSRDHCNDDDIILSQYHTTISQYHTHALIVMTMISYFRNIILQFYNIILSQYHTTISQYHTLALILMTMKWFYAISYYNIARL